MTVLIKADYVQQAAQLTRNGIKHRAVVLWNVCPSRNNNAQSTINRLTSSSCRAILQMLILAAASTRRGSMSARDSQLSAHHHNDYSLLHNVN